MNERKKWWKNLSLFEKAAVILISVLICVIIVTAIVIANNNDEINTLKRKNNEISENLAYSLNITKFDNDFNFYYIDNQ